MDFYFTHASSAPPFPLEHIDSSFLTYDAFSSTFDPSLNVPAKSGSLEAPGVSPQGAARTLDSNDADADLEHTGRTRSSSEEKEELTPAQSRRKAQNRAAQRAFRERKERHVKDLEAKLTSLESATHNLKSDNERLKLALERATTEIELLRATSGHGPLSSPPSPLILPGSDVNIETAPDMALKNAYVSAYPASIPSSTLLPVSATWDLIQSHHLFKAGLVDIGDVCERLKKVTKCDGEGPAFEEADVWKAVEESRRSGGDELI